FLAGLEGCELPVAHAEGKFVARDNHVMEQLAAEGRLVLRYSNRNLPAEQSGQLAYPTNPNGSEGNVAGICDRTGRVLGLMPHPERFIRSDQHPQWTRRPPIERGDGLVLFENAVAYFR